MIRCKKCEPTKYFKDISSIRKHQWKAHYDDTLGKRRLKKPGKELVPLVYSQPAQNGEMTVSTLLDKLRTQRDFMNNVVALVEGLTKEQ